jgi:NitT/TauT family transport system permease protein
VTADRVRVVVAPAAVLVVFVGLWQVGLFNHLFALPAFAVPRPSSIAVAASENRDALWAAMSETGVAVLLGWAFGNGVGLVLALGLLTLPQRLAGRIGNFFGSFQALPVIAIAPLVALWLGGGLWFKVTTVLVMVFPQMVVYAFRGLTAVDLSVLELGCSYNCTKWQVLRFFRLPMALVQIFTSLRYSVVLALIGVVVCEIIRSANGLGYEIHDALQRFNAPAAWAAVVVLALSGILGYSALVAIERLALPWVFHRS